MHLALCDRDGAALNEVAAELADAGVEVMTVELDARDTDAVSGFFDAADTRFGARCDVWSTWSAARSDSPSWSPIRVGWDALIRTNFTWLLHSTQLAVARHGSNRGVAASSTSPRSRDIGPHRATPSTLAMKAAVTSLTWTLAVELAPDNIRVNTIAPDDIATPGLGFPRQLGQ